MEHGDTPDMVYGRLLEAAHISGYTFERVCGELEWLMTDNRWRQIGPGYTDINTFLRSVDFSAFNLQDKRPHLVRRIKELQPEASNRAIAQAIGVAEGTVRNDQRGRAQDCAPAPAAEAAEAESTRSDAQDCALAPAEAEVEELPAFLDGDDWSPRQRVEAFRLYTALPADLQPTVAALLDQPGICVPDMLAMLAHIASMDTAQQAELVRLQTSADAYERSCAITMALDRPPLPHPRIMLLYEVRRELMALSRRVESAAARYPDLPGASQVGAWAAQLAALAHDAEALIGNLERAKEVSLA